jgi:hypothetical protein
MLLWFDKLKCRRHIIDKLFFLLSPSNGWPTNFMASEISYYNIFLPLCRFHSLNPLGHAWSNTAARKAEVNSQICYSVRLLTLSYN